MTSTAARILVVDDDRVFRLSTAELLRQDGYEVVAVEDGEAAVSAMREAAFDLILLDLRMPGAGGMQVIEVLRRWGEAIPVLMITGYGSIDAAVSALHTGADDFLTKPVDPDVLSSRVAELLERRPAARAVKEAALRGIVGRSGTMQEVFQLVRTVSPMETTVLLTGETGTGKEIVARAVHDLSRRNGKPFVPVDCASMAEGVLESELFGHTKGAFTGAVRDKRGLFEAADRGTIFLDEIGDTSPAVQQRLLRVLQEREITPVGSVAVRRVDVRVIAATNRDLPARIAEGLFREDLYYRLNVFHIRLPPLRERRSDIPLLVEAALERVRTSHPEFVHLSSSPLAMRMLRSYDWPGNVRELFSVVESSAIRAGGARIEGQHLPPAVRRSPDKDGNLQEERYRAPDDERAAIQAALDEAGGVRARAAELLGMGRTTLWRKLKQYGLDDRSGA